MFTRIKYYISKTIKKSRLNAIKNSKIYKGTKIASGCNVINSKIGKYSDIGYDNTIINTQIGNFVCIASNCIIGGAGHPLDWVSISTVFYNHKDQIKTKFARHPYNPVTATYIGNDVWIGDKALIKAGVRISDGAVIGMGSVVTKNVGPYEIWAGNPAKLIRKRFTDEKIQALLSSKWWDMGEKELKYYGKFFNDVDLFIKRVNEK